MQTGWSIKLFKMTHFYRTCNKVVQNIKVFVIKTFFQGGMSRHVSVKWLLQKAPGYHLPALPVYRGSVTLHTPRMDNVTGVAVETPQGLTDPAVCCFFMMVPSASSSYRQCKIVKHMLLRRHSDVLCRRNFFTQKEAIIKKAQQKQAIDFDDTQLEVLADLFCNMLRC